MGLKISNDLENLISNLAIAKNNYATTEQKVGTWLGKPLYRKVLHHTKTTGTSDTINTNIQNVDSLWVDHAGSFCKNGNFYLGISNYGGGEDWIRAYALGSNVYLQTGTVYSSIQLDCYISIYYTKTTD